MHIYQSIVAEKDTTEVVLAEEAARIATEKEAQHIAAEQEAVRDESSSDIDEKGV